MDTFTSYKKLDRRSRRRIKLIIFLIFCLTVGWILFSPQGTIRYFKLRQEINTVREENRRLREENKNIRRELDRLKNDPAYLEEVARKKFGLIKKNEIIFDLE